MKKLSIALLVSMLFVIAVSGCQENNSPAPNRRAAMIGGETLRVEINQKNAKITELQSELDKSNKKIK